MSSVASVKTFAKTIPQTSVSPKGYREGGACSRPKLKHRPIASACLRGRIQGSWLGEFRSQGSNSSDNSRSGSDDNDGSSSIHASHTSRAARQLARSAGKSKARARTTALPQAKPKQAKSPAVSGMEMRGLCCGRNGDWPRMPEIPGAAPASLFLKPLALVYSVYRVCTEVDDVLVSACGCCAMRAVSRACACTS